MSRGLTLITLALAAWLAVLSLAYLIFTYGLV